MRDRKIPESHPGSQPPEKPRRPPREGSGISQPARNKSDVTVLTKEDMIVETCSCGSSIAMPHFFTGQEEARKNWREEHKHSDFSPFSRACPDPSVHSGDLLGRWRAAEPDR